MDYWLTLLLGERRRDSVASIRFGEWQERIYWPAERTEENYRIVESFFALLGNEPYITYHFSRKTKPLGHHLENQGSAYGTTHYVHHHEVQEAMKTGNWSFANPDSLTQGLQRWYTPVFLANEFLQVVLHRYNHAYPSIDQKLRFNQ